MPWSPKPQAGRATASLRRLISLVMVLAFFAASCSGTTGPTRSAPPGVTAGPSGSESASSAPTTIADAENGEEPVAKPQTEYEDLRTAIREDPVLVEALSNRSGLGAGIGFSFDVVTGQLLVALPENVDFEAIKEYLLRTYGEDRVRVGVIGLLLPERFRDIPLPTQPPAEGN